VPSTDLYGELQDIEVIPTAISQMKDGLNVHCYPNPFHSTFTIQVNGDYRYQVFNAVGCLVESRVGHDRVELGKQLNKGIYFLRIAQDQRNKSIKLIKY
ncbi:MAG TPA: T9SS type A sorting domain-containing protein, partial [Sunxiuqinia sp.]|nr:T9SS type A sorting domain-containing protein [Sunxiuqinia sp.]